MHSRSRTNKLYRRLDAVESELRRHLVQEFQSELAGTETAFLSPYLRNSKYVDVDAVRIDILERLVSQVRSLRAKLGEPRGPVLTVLTRFVDTWNDLGTKQNASDRRALVKQALSELDACDAP